MITPQVVITRGNNIVNCPSSTLLDGKLQYSNLNKQQFLIYCRQCLKEKILGYCNNLATWNTSLSGSYNSFMENIPDVLLDFSSEESCRLLLKYLDSNIRLMFNGKLNREEVYGLIMELKYKDPRLKPTTKETLK